MPISAETLTGIGCAVGGAAAGARRYRHEDNVRVRHLIGRQFPFDASLDSGFIGNGHGNVRGAPNHRGTDLLASIVASFAVRLGGRQAHLTEGAGYLQSAAVAPFILEREFIGFAELLALATHGDGLGARCRRRPKR